MITYLLTYYHPIGGLAADNSSFCGESVTIRLAFTSCRRYNRYRFAGCSPAYDAWQELITRAVLYVIIAAVLPVTEDSAVFIVIWHSRLTEETTFPFLFSLLSAPVTVFCDNVTLISTFYNNNIINDVSLHSIRRYVKTRSLGIATITFTRNSCPQTVTCRLLFL